MILNAKSGICPEDCGYCGQSRDVKQKSQRYALIPENQIVEGAKVASENKIGTYCIVMSGRGPDKKRFLTLLILLSKLKEIILNLKFVHVSD